MAEQEPVGPARSDINTQVDLQKDGVLWMLNTTVFHPRGLALAIEPTTGKLFLQGDGDEVWVFKEETAESGFQRFGELLDRHFEKFE